MVTPAIPWAIWGLMLGCPSQPKVVTFRGSEPRADTDQAASPGPRGDNLPLFLGLQHKEQKDGRRRWCSKSFLGGSQPCQRFLQVVQCGFTDHTRFSWFSVLFFG